MTAARSFRLPCFQFSPFGQGAPQHGPSALFDRSSLVICFSLRFERPLQLFANAAIASSRVEMIGFKALAEESCPALAGLTIPTVWFGLEPLAK